MRLFWCTLGATIVTYSRYLVFFEDATELVYGGVLLLGFVCLILAITTPNHDPVIALCQKFDEIFKDFGDFGDSFENLAAPLIAITVGILLIAVVIVATLLYHYTKQTMFVVAVGGLAWFVNYTSGRRAVSAKTIETEEVYDDRRTVYAFFTLMAVVVMIVATLLWSWPKIIGTALALFLLYYLIGEAFDKRAHKEAGVELN